MTRMLRQVLAVKRLTRLIVHDMIFEDLRAALFDRWPPDDHKLTYLLSCEKCVSVWASALVVGGVVPDWLVDTLAASEAVILASEGMSRWVSEI